MEGKCQDLGRFLDHSPQSYNLCFIPLHIYTSAHNTLTILLSAHTVIDMTQEEYKLSSFLSGM